MTRAALETLASNYGVPLADTAGYTRTDSELREAVLDAIEQARYTAETAVLRLADKPGDPCPTFYRGELRHANLRLQIATLDLQRVQRETAGHHFSPHARAARAVKVRKLVEEIDHQAALKGYDARLQAPAVLRTVESWTTAQWGSIAVLAAVRPPSSITREQVLEVLRTRVRRAQEVA